jgi:hypothetical protein
MTVRGRSLPTHWSIYRSEFEGVQGFVVSIDGRSAFITPEEAREAAAYLSSVEDTNTAPVDVTG